MTTATVNASRQRTENSKPQWMSGDQLKTLYPELDGWASKIVSKAFFAWQRATGISVVETDKRDERFPTFLVNVMLDKQVGRK
jgi:hypothetical protein